MLPIADRHVPYAHLVATDLGRHGIRSEVDDRTESVGRKIRDAELQKVPYMLVVGDKEEDDHKVAVRRHREGDEGAVSVAELADRLSDEIARRS